MYILDYEVYVSDKSDVIFVLLVNTISQVDFQHFVIYVNIYLMRVRPKHLFSNICYTLRTDLLYGIPPNDI